MMTTPHGAANAQAVHDDHAPGLAQYWDAVYGQKWLIAAVTLGVMALVLVVTLLMTNKYRATTSLLIEREAIKVVNVEGVIPTESPTDRDFYQTQYELLKSRSLARRVIGETRLAEHPEYKEIAEEALERKPPGKENGTREDIVGRALTGAVLESLEVEPVRASRLVRVHFLSADPELAARVANAYGRVFIAHNLERRVEASTVATGYLSDRLAEIRGRVETSEKQLVEFSQDEQIVSMGDGQLSLPAQNLGELNALLAAAQQNRIRAEATWQQARAGDGMGLPQVVASPLIQTLRVEQAKLASEYQQKLPTFKPGYPEMQRLSSQMNEGKRQIATEVAHIRASLRNDYETAQKQELLLQSAIDQLKRDELDLQNRSIRYNMIKREVDTNRQLYDGLLQRFKEVGVVGDIGANNVTVVDQAEAPGRPYSPRKLLALALAAVFGLFLGVTVALVRYFLRSGSIRSA